MTRDEYDSLRDNVVLFGSLVRTWPIEDGLAAISRADSVGALIDPTLWRNGQEEMHKYERLLKALLPFKQAVLELAPGDEKDGAA